MPIELAAINASTISITTIVLDLVSSNPSEGYLEALLEEASAILSENDGQWNRASLARSSRADLALRESICLNNFMSRNVIQKVIPEQGILIRLRDGSLLKELS